MPRAAARFRQADISRAIKAAQSAGLTVTSTRIDASGAIEVICSQSNADHGADESALDRWLSKKDSNNARHNKT